MEILSSLKHVIPYQLLIMGFSCYVLSKFISPLLSIFIFIFLYVFSIMGLDSFSIIFIFFGIYILGYYTRLILFGNKDFSFINFTYGLITLFPPIFLFSAISSTGLFQSHYFHSTKLLSFIIFICIVAPIIFFIYKEKVQIISFFSRGIHDENFNFLSFFIVTILLSIITYATIPIINYDDLGTHFLIQSQFSLGKYSTFDVSNHVWSLSQWVFDVYYGFFELVYNYHGRTVLNILISISIVFISLEILENYFNRISSLLIVLLCLSTPLYALALTTSQTELITVLLLVSFIKIIFKFNSKSFLFCLPILAFAVSLKASNAVLFIVPFIFILFLEINSHGFSNLKRFRNIVVLLLSSLMAFSVYIFSYVKIGNPFFPLFNAIFKSNYFPNTNFYNHLYSGNFNFYSFYGVIFETSKYLESYDGVAGFQLILLPIFLVVCLITIRANFNVKALFFAFVLGALGLFYSQQYARYMMPVIVTLPIFFSIIVRKKIIISFSVKMLFYIAIVGLIFSNLIRQPFAIWYMSNWKNSTAISSIRTRDHISQLDNILSVNVFLNATPGQKVVVYPYEKPYASNLNGSFVYVNWYNTEGYAAYLGGYSKLLKFFKKKEVTHIILISGNNDVLRDIAEDNGKILYNNGGYEVYSLNLNN